MVAVAFVTWMIFWRRRTARHLKAQLHGRLDAALALGGVALVLTAFLAVGREGLETALFLWSAVRATGQSNAPLVGIVAGLGVAVVLGYLLYRRAVALNLAKAEGGHHVAAGGLHYLRRHQQGPEVTEVYVYAAGDRGERENFGPGTTHDLAVTLAAGNYDVACKPKMTGDGIRTKITVTK